MLAPIKNPAQIWQEYMLLEMSVMPIPHEWKRPDFRWKKLKWAKLWMLMDTQKGRADLTELFRLGGGGLAVICGRPSENLFVLDCDTRERLAVMRYALWQRGIVAPVVLSSRGGHIYLRSREGAVKSIAAGTVPDVEVQGDGALVVLPPTRHKSGVVYQWDGQMPRHIPTVSIEQIDFLTDADGNAVTLQTATSERRLHDDTRRYLASGQRTPEGQRNVKLWDAARDYEWVGKSLGDAMIDLLPIAIESGLCESEVSATISQAFKGNRPESQKNHDSNSITARLEAFMAGAKWEGRKGKTDKAVFAALIQRRRVDGYHRGDGTFRASYRELMQLARINSWRTVQRSIERFVSYGWLKACGSDKDTTANLYRFTEMAIAAGAFFQVQRVHTKQQGALRSSYCGHFAQLAESTALGRTGLDILQAIRIVPTPQTPKDISATLGIHRTTASRHMKRLEELGLLISVNGGYIAQSISPAQEAEICRQTGAYKSDVERQMRIDLDRATFALMPILKFLYDKNKRMQEAAKP
jgi:DNA-binding MarR family transcriptional regulator